MLASVVIDRRHFTLSDLREGHRQAAPFALLLPTPLPHLSPLLPVIYALFCVFLHTLKTQLFSFHTLPHSFTKTKGGRTSSKCFSRILTSLESASLKSRTK